MDLSRRDIINAYKDCDYWPGKNFLRIIEMNIPLFLSRIVNEKDITIDTVTDSKIEIHLSKENVCIFLPILIHESLFHFYKAFYNYLATRNLYFGGFLHWIKVSIYYAQFYLAKSLNILLGSEKYGIKSQRGGLMKWENVLFNTKIAEALSKNRKTINS